MTSRKLQEAIDIELSAIAEELKTGQFDDYKKLAVKPVVRSKNIHGKEFNFTSWAEPVVGGEGAQLAVLTDTWKKKLFWSSRFMKGFIASPQGFLRDLNNEELWEYD